MEMKTLILVGVLYLVTLSTSTNFILPPRIQHIFGKSIVDYRQIPGVHWDYGVKGPHTWHGSFPSYCAGQLQSPVNLRESSATPRGCPPLSFTNYDDAAVSMTIKNVEGVSATATVTSATPPRVAGGCLTGVYKLEKIMWHWGATRKQGSEHMINDRSFAMEMQLVHYKESYGSYENALQHKDGVVIVAVVYKQVGTSEHPTYDFIANALRYVKNPNTMRQFFNSEKLSSLMPMNRNQYYMYEGSTTHPRCEEVVTWLVFKQYGKLSHNQVQPFRELRTLSGHDLLNNYRPLQLLNNRPIYKIGF